MHKKNESNSKVDFVKESCLVLATNKNSLSKYGDNVTLFSLKIWQLLHFFFQFFFGSPQPQNLPKKRNTFNIEYNMNHLEVFKFL
jgi:hypothetical protein